MKENGFTHIDPDTGITFEYRPTLGVVYIYGKGETVKEADKLTVGKNRRFIQSQRLRMVSDYKRTGGRKYAEWQEADDYIQLSMIGGMGLVM